MRMIIQIVFHVVLDSMILEEHVHPALHLVQDVHQT